VLCLHQSLSVIFLQVSIVRFANQKAFGELAYFTYFAKWDLLSQQKLSRFEDGGKLIKHKELFD